MMVIAWLSYLTRNNFHARHEQTIQSLKSLQGFSTAETEIIIVDNSEIDNFETAKLRDKYLKDVQIFKAANEFCDVAAHLTAYCSAFDNDLFCYTYDDFVFYRHDWIQDITRFMQNEQYVACCRIPMFDCDSLGYFDADVITKTNNPEAVRLSNTHRNKSFFKKSSQYSTEKTEFFTTVLRPISRPSVWNPKHFDKFIPETGTVPTLQQFEKHLYNICDAQDVWTSAILNKGVCKTFPQDTSERIKQGLGISKSSPVFDIKYFDEVFEASERWI